jgi:dethiobiotin synthase
MNFSERIRTQLAEIEAKGLNRTLKSPHGLDFSSNDILCLANSKELINSAIGRLKQFGVGSTGSRLLRGESEVFAEVEKQFAVWKGAEKSLSPHLSARLAKVEITVDKILQYLESANHDKIFIIEGAGGILIPLNEKELMVDLMRALNLPVIIVARSGLGTINHTCSTLEVLRNKGLEVFGVIMNGDPNLENKKAIEHYGKVKVIAEIPKTENIWTDFNSIPNLESEIWNLK